MIRKPLFSLLVVSLVSAAFTGRSMARPPANPEGEKRGQPAGGLVPPHVAKQQQQQPGTPAISQPGQPVQPGAAQPNAPTPTVELKPGEIPKIEFDTPVYDFGRIKTGTDVAHDFWFHNTGNGPLEILQVKPSCGCTTSGQYDRIVMPGQSGKIPLKVSTGHATGPISKSVTVVTNIPGAGSTTSIQFKGELWQLIQATPNSALFGNVSAAQTKEGPMVRKLTIQNNGDQKPSFGDLKCSNPAFTADLKELEPGKKWELTVTLGQNLTTGVQSGMLDIATGLAEMPKLQIACSAYLVADVDVVPNKMVLPAARTVSLQRDFYVRNNGSKPLHLSDLAASNQKLKVGLQETQTGMAWRITMEVPSDYEIPREGDKITFKTDHPNYPVITIPISVALSQNPAVANTAVVPQQKPTVVGATPVGNPPVVQGAVKGPAKPADSHDHAGHDHAGHDHSQHAPGGK